MKVLLYDPDLQWGEQMAIHMKCHGIDVTAAEELEDLWCAAGEIQGILVSMQEMESMIFWGEDIVDGVGEICHCPAAIRSLCRQGKKVVMILPEQDYETECACLQAGASECIHKNQPFELIIQRLLLAFREELRQDVIWFEGMQYHRLSGMLVYQDRCIGLTKMEQRVFEVLLERGRELTEKQEIVLQLWGKKTDGGTKQRLETLIKQIRHKLQGFPIGICNRYGRGYYLEMK